LRGTPAAFTAGHATKQAMMTEGATYSPGSSYRDSDGVGGGLTKGKWQARLVGASPACLVRWFGYVLYRNAENVKLK
jgi:hypothetical protein